MCRKRQDVSFYAFDLLWLNGEDLQALPLLERKRMLRRVIRGHNGVLYAGHILHRGVGLFGVVREKDQ
jgi:bifunctional non-homologous end joining protein LigD